MQFLSRYFDKIFSMFLFKIAKIRSGARIAPTVFLPDRAGFPQASGRIASAPDGAGLL